MPKVPPQDRGWTLLWKALGSRIPLKQMGKSRLLPGGVPAPFPFLPQVVFWDGWILSPSHPSRCGSCFMRLPGVWGPLQRDPGRGRFACGCECFPCKHGLCQSVSSYMWWGGHVTGLLPSAAGPWGWATLGPPRPGDLWKEDHSSQGPLSTLAGPGQAQSQGHDSPTSQAWWL